MRFEEVYDRWAEDRLTQREAADVLGVCDRRFSRQGWRCAEALEGYAHPNAPRKPENGVPSPTV